MPTTPLPRPKRCAPHGLRPSCLWNPHVKVKYWRTLHFRRMSTSFLRLAATIGWRHLEQIGHRRKLLAFLILTPIVLVLLFGLAFGEQTIPAVSLSELDRVVDEIRDDPLLSSVIQIFERLRNYTAEDVRILVGAFPSPRAAPSEAWLFVVPGDVISVVFVDVDQYYFVTFFQDGTLDSWGVGPFPPPAGGSTFEQLPTLDLRPLLSEEAGRQALETMRRVFRISLDFLTAKRVRTLDLLFPEIVGIQLAWSGVLGAAALSIEDRIAGARKRILLAPIRRATFLLGNAWANFLLIGLQLAILFLIAVGVFHVGVGGSAAEIALVLALAASALVGIGLIVAHLSRTADEVFYLATLVNLPMMFFSSRILPVQESAVGQVLRNVFPTTYSNAALGHLMVAGGSLTDVGGALVSLAVMAVVLYAFGTYLLARER